MDQHFDIGKKCFGIYLGTVVQHLTHGQLKVYIQGIYPQEWAETPALLPICQQVTPQFGGSHDGNGTFSYPNIGSTVVCMFANGDQNLPLTFGSILGGMNAFGQYEHIKTNDELCSSRHLVTAGKSHIEMYESGKISAVVVDPIRTQAEVSYGTEVDAPLSIDAVTSRPICEKVEAKQLSSIDCQFVMDNFYGHGTVSSSTHWYDPVSLLSTTILSNLQQTIIDKRSGETIVDSYCVVDNDGHREFGQSRSIQSNTISNVTDLANQENTNEIVPLTSTVKTSFKHNLDGTNTFSTTSAMTDAYNYSYYNNATKASILSTHNIKTTANSSFGSKIDSSFGISGEVSKKSTEAYQNSQTGDNKTLNLKYTNHSSLIADGNNNMLLKTLSSSRLTETDMKLGIDMHTNKHYGNAIIDQSSHRGIMLEADWQDDDMKSMNGTTSQEKHTNYAYADIASGENPSIEIKTQKKYTKSINGSQQDYNVICEDIISPTDGKITVKILDKMTKLGCLIEMDSKGNLTLSSSTMLTIDAPTVMMKGQMMTQTFTSYATTAQTLMLTGIQGDCKIKNVSLLNHKHQETQAGDVVRPQPTKIATQSN